MLPPASCRPTRRQAVRALGFGLFFWLVLQVGMIVAVAAYPRLRDPLYGDKAVRLLRRALVEPRPRTIVMIGSSRTGFGFHGRRIEARLKPIRPESIVAYNFGIPSSGPITHLIYLRRLLAAGLRPDLLLVEVLPPMLGRYPGRTPLEKLWFYPDRMTYDELRYLESYGFPRSETEPKWLHSALNPWFSLRFQLAGRVVPGWIPWSVRYDWSRGTDESGWNTPMRTTVTPAEYAKGIAQAQAEYEIYLRDLQPAGPALTALTEIARLCRENAVPLYFVLMPEGKDFRAWYSPTVNQRLRFALDEIGRHHNTRVIDCREWVPDHEFSDAHHLLRPGAEHFSDRMTDEVLQPFLQGRGLQ